MYGFVYLWKDCKRGKFYIGCHWGTEDDGYVCSSTVMRNAYRRRPKDFRRRVLARVHTNRADLLEIEHRWLQLIEDQELGRKYYNLSKRHFGHWTADPTQRLTVGQKVSKALTGKPSPKKGTKTKPHSEETRLKMSASQTGRKHSEATRLKMSQSKKGIKVVAAGTVWVTDGTVNKRVDKTKIPAGFVPGRTIVK